MSEVKRGMLKFYHRGLLHKKWKEYKFILYESSLLTWYADVKHKKPDGMVLLKDVERFICVGPYTRFLPDFPSLENEYDQVLLIAFPQSIKERDRDIVWLLCENMEDLNLWMKAIVQTLPSHTLEMARMTKISSLSMDENIQSISELNSPDITHSPDRIILKTDAIGLPLAAGLLATRLQGHTMTSRESPLQKAGYDYGNTLWGTGEGWGCCSPMNPPGYVGIGGGYPNRVDLIENEDDEEQVKDVEEQIDDEQATYEVFKNENEDSRNDQNEEDDSDREESEDDLQMIDHDTEE